MYQLTKRIFDFISSLVVVILFFPFFIIIAIWILLDSPGGIFYKQIRVGKDGKEFTLLKFRSMTVGADKQGLITVGNDNRVTRSGRFIRKTKIDEFPQLINILKGDMSVVGPRPEVPKYVALYTEDQKKVLSVRPGLTDLASLKYFDEQKLLGESDDPEKTYRNEIMPKKLELNLQYLAQQSLFLDFKLIFSTIFRIFK
ncbi:MAG: sugar transferase [Crocinitomicaceae bacterium]|nr:sugar transferase [Crocinitomicaceae bacterium]